MMVTLDPKQMEAKTIYKFMIGAIVPRPIAFISTLSPQRIGNLAPFSFFNGVSSNPPAVMIAITRKSNGDKKDTLLNIESTSEFVVNNVSEPIAKKMNQCSAEYPYGVDEMQKVGLTPLPSSLVRPSRVKESSVHLECKLYDTLEVGDGSEGSSTIVVGTIQMIHIDENVYQNGRILLEKLNPLCRLAGGSYGLVSEVFDLPRGTV